MKSQYSSLISRCKYIFQLLTVVMTFKSCALFFFFILILKQDELKLDSNKDIFYNKHKFEAVYMYLRQVSGRGYRTKEPFGSIFNTLPLSYTQAHNCSQCCVKSRECYFEIIFGKC